MTRKHQADRIARLAGIDPDDGGILRPGPDFHGINRRNPTWWNSATAPRREPNYKGDLAVCTVCGKTWREAEAECLTPQDCNFVREDKP